MSKKTKAPTDAQLVKLASSVIDSRNTIPVLHTALMLTHGASGSQLITTDMDHAVTVGLDSTIDVDGLIMPKTLHAILGIAPNVAIRDGVADVAGRVSSDLDMRDFPQWTRALPSGATSRFTIAVGLLLPALEYVRRAVSTEETRYYLNGVYLHASGLPSIGDGVDDGALRMVATDGHRMHMHTFLPEDAIAPTDNVNGGNIIWPRASINLAVDAMKLHGPDAVAEIEWSETTRAITFRLGRVLIQSKAIDGTFPDYARVMTDAAGEPTASVVMLACDRKSLEAGYKVAKTRIEGRAVPQLIVKTCGAAAWKEPLSTIADVKAGFNGSIVLDAINSATARLVIVDAASPARVEFPDVLGRSAVIMPMRV